jgi:hypothetical protein
VIGKLIRGMVIRYGDNWVIMMKRKVKRGIEEGELMRNGGGFYKLRNVEEEKEGRS